MARTFRLPVVTPLRTGRFAALAAGCAFFSLTLTGAVAHAKEELRVRADAEFVNLGLMRGASAVEVSGTLHDDAGRAVGDATVALTIPSDPSPHPLPCRSGDAPKAANGVVTMRADALGFFCVRLGPTASVEGDELHYEGDRFHSAT